jgi:hypothetical protein
MTMTMKRYRLMPFVLWVAPPHEEPERWINAILDATNGVVRIINDPHAAVRELYDRKDLVDVLIVEPHWWTFERYERFHSKVVTTIVAPIEEAIKQL